MPRNKKKQPHCTETTNTSLGDPTFGLSFLASSFLKTTSVFVRMLEELSIWVSFPQYEFLFQASWSKFGLQTLHQKPAVELMPLTSTHREKTHSATKAGEQSGHNIFLKGVWTGGVQGQALDEGLSIAPVFEARG